MTAPDAVVSTVLVLQRHPAHPSHRSEYAAVLSELAQSARAADGCLWADTAEAADDEPSFVLLAEFRTPADAEAWLAGAEHASALDKLDPWQREAPTLRTFSAT